MTHVPFALSTALALPWLAATLAAQGLPPMAVPAGNPVTPAKAVLGKALFWEEQLSSNNRVACGTCHRPAFGGGDPRRLAHPGLDGVQPSQDDTFGSPGVIRSDTQKRYLPSPQFNLREQVTGRASPSFLTGAWFPEMFWDGRARGLFADPEGGATVLAQDGALESQAAGPILNGVEMAHDGRLWGDVRTKLQASRPMALATNVPADVAAAIAAAPTYPDLFAAAFGDPAITATRIAMAIATYERTLVPDQTPWDQFQRGVTSALTPQQVNGMNVFNGPGRCSLCHTPGLFSDRQFRNLGLRPIAQDVGRQAVTGSAADRGKFKVPSLRNAALRTSFMHTGQFLTLDAVVGFYQAGGGPNPDNKDPLLLPINLPPQARGDLVNFLANGLIDPRVQNEQFPFDRPTLASERIPPQGFLYNPGSPGTGGIVPQMLAEVPANVGNVDFKVGVGNALGGASAALVVSTAAAPLGTQFAGVNLNVALPEFLLLPSLLGGAAGVAGAGFATFQVPLPADPGLAGATLFAQWFVLDPGVAPGASSTRGAEIRFF